MSLRERILVILLFMLCCYAGLEFVVLKQIIEPELLKQEQLQGKERLRRCTDALQRHLNNLHKDVSALARSGQLYTLVHSPSSNLLDQITSQFDLDFIFIYDNTWKQTLTGTENIKPESIEQIFFGGQRPLINKSIPGYSDKAIARYQDQLLFIISAPITQNALSKTVEGTIVAGEYITKERLEELRDKLQLNFDWDFLNSKTLVGQNMEIVNRVSAGEPFDLIILGPKYLQASAVLYDYQKQPALLIKIFQDLAISQESLKTMIMALCGKIIIGVVAVLLLTWLIQRLVINPIIKLIKHIVNIGDPCKRKELPAISRKDEIGTLASEFNHMCQRLQSAQLKLMEKSYLSGVTEMSSGILHNVRNALSPIITRIERIKGQFQKIPLSNLEQAQAELTYDSLDPKRREDLMRFVDLTFQDVIGGLKEMVTGLDDLAEQVIQIEDMLNLQRTFGKEDKPVEFVNPADLLNKALDMIPQEHRSRCRITIDPKIKKLPAIPVEPTTFVQILQNLLINAAESIEKQQTLYRKINIRAAVESDEKKPMLHWQIQDNGIGIPQDKLQKIFERGASSKSKGLTGIGLHWCANTITAMKGRIWAESPGPNNGATFHVVIPMAPETELIETAKGNTE